MLGLDAMGPQCFFGIALRLLVQRWLAERRMPLPVALWNCFEVLDADWCFAAGRLVLGARAPVVVAISARTRLEQCAGMLFALDWSAPDAPLFVVSPTATGAQVRRAKLGSA